MKSRNRTFISLCLASMAAVAVLPPGAQSAQRSLDIAGVVHQLPGGGATMRQKGGFNGAPFGSGSVTLRTSVGTGRGATFTFDMVTNRGTVHGTGNVALRFPGTMITYNGTARITQGSGAFRTMRANNLRITGSGQLSGESFRVRLTGSVSG